MNNEVFEAFNKGRLSIAEGDVAFGQAGWRRTGSEGQKYHGLHGMPLLRIHLLLQDPPGHSDQGGQSSGKGDEVIC